MRSRATRLLFVATIAGLTAVASAVATPAALAHGCPPTGRSATPFGSWGDTTSYVPVRWGGFAAWQGGSRSWGGPAFGSGSASSGGAPDLSSIYLAPGGSATSGDTCGPWLLPAVRFFVRNVGASDGLLHVEVLVNDGRDGVLDGGTISASDSWAPSPEIVLPRADVHPGAVAFAVRLTPVGDGAAFLVDDVYIDPFQSR